MGSYSVQLLDWYKSACCLLADGGEFVVQVRALGSVAGGHAALARRPSHVAGRRL